MPGIRPFLTRLPLLAAAVIACGSNVPAPLRLALVIGNGNYTTSDPLPNAISDARKLSARLTKLGFRVEPDTFDLDRKKLGDTIAAFGAKMRAAGQNTIVFFYYAGHAAQDRAGVNYLLPIDAKARRPADIHDEGTPMPLVLQAMEDANNPINILVLDACRDWFKGDREPGDPKGLRDMGRHASMFIAYATRDNDTADDGAGDSSPFSRRLIEALETQPNEAIVLLFDDVKTLVNTDTDSGQLPLLVDGLTVSGRWSLNSGALADVAAKPQPAGAPGLSPFLQALDRQQLLTFFRGKESLVDVLLARRDILQLRHIDTPLQLAHFLGSIGYESGGFRVSEEKFGYSAAALRRLFPHQVTSDAMAQQIAGKVEAVANTVYARPSLGNGPPESGDGWRYRGRGIFGFFITGRANYKRYGDMIGVDLIKAPDLMNDPEIALAVSAAVWQAMRATPAAEADDLALVTRRLRGPGAQPAEMRARETWLAQAKRAVGQ